MEYAQGTAPETRSGFGEIEKWTMTKDKMEVMNTLNPLNVPCGPVLSMKEIAAEPALRNTGTVVEVDHPERGKYLTVGNPIKLSDSPAEVERAPLLGEHTQEVLKTVLGLDDKTSKPRASRARSNGLVAYNVLILGASYGSLFGTKLLLAGHSVKLVCTKPTADLINRDGTMVRFPIRGRETPVEIASKSLPGSFRERTGRSPSRRVRPRRARHAGIPVRLGGRS